MHRDHERESRECLSGEGANRRDVPEDRMRRFEGYMSEIFTAFEPDSR